MHPKSGFWIGQKSDKKTMMSQFSEKTSCSNFFDGALFLLSGNLFVQ